MSRPKEELRASWKESPVRKADIFKASGEGGTTSGDASGGMGVHCGGGPEVEGLTENDELILGEGRLLPKNGQMRRGGAWDI